MSLQLEDVVRVERNYGNQRDYLLSDTIDQKPSALSKATRYDFCYLQWKDGKSKDNECNNSHFRFAVEYKPIARRMYYLNITIRSDNSPKNTLKHYLHFNHKT